MEVLTQNQIQLFSFLVGDLSVIQTLTFDLGGHWRSKVQNLIYLIFNESLVFITLFGTQLTSMFLSPTAKLLALLFAFKSLLM